MAAISPYLEPMRETKTSNALKAERTRHRVTFNPNKASPGETLYISVPKLDEGTVLAPGSLFVVFNLTALGHASNFFTQNLGGALVSPMVVSPMVVKFGREKLEDKYRIPLDHQILTDHGVFYPRGLSDELVFEITLNPANVVVRGPDPDQLGYELTNIQLQYEVICDKRLAMDCAETYLNGKTFLYDQVTHHKTLSLDKAADTIINESINVPRRSMKGILFLFCDTHVPGERDSERYLNPNLKMVKVSVNGVPNKINSQGIVNWEHFENASNFLGRIEDFRGMNYYANERVNADDFFLSSKFGLIVDLRSIKDDNMHGCGLPLINTKDGVQLEIQNKGAGSGNMKCHIFVIADAQFNILNNELESVMY